MKANTLPSLVSIDLLQVKIFIQFVTGPHMTNSWRDNTNLWVGVPCGILPL